MKFLQPLGLLGLIGIPIIIIINLVKSRYTQKPVSSTFIWKRSLRYVKRKVPLSFMVSLLLVLQILTVATASFAVARPTIVPWSSGEKIIILDSSASMLTSDGEKTRFELAKEKAIAEADKAGDNSRITIITAGVEAKNRISRSADKVDITNTVKDLECEKGDADIAGALKFANTIQNANSDATIYLYTDKDYDAVQGVEVVNFSRYEEWNAAILSVTDEKVAGNYEFTVKLASYARDTETVVSLYVDGVLANSKKIKINSVTEDYMAASGGSMEPTTVKFTPYSKGEDGEILINSVSSYGNVKVEISAQDGNTCDNEYYLFSENTASARVLFVSKWVEMTEEGIVNIQKSTFLLASLRNLGMRIETEDIKNSVDGIPEYTGYDIYIFDGVMPESLPEDGATWFIDPPADPVGTTVKTGEAVTVTDDTADGFRLKKSFDTGNDIYAELTKNISSGRVAMRSYRPITSYDGYCPLFECNGDTVAVAGQILGKRIIVLSFDFHDTNFPIYLDFPLLINNMMKYSARESLEKRAFEVGETVSFFAPAGSKTMSFKKDGFVLSVSDAVDSTYLLDSLGNYEIEVEFADGKTKSYMMPTHISEDESNTKSVGDTIIAEQVSATSSSRPEAIEIWPYLAILLLLLLVVEWGVYYKDEF